VDSIVVEQLGKCYRLGKPPGPSSLPRMLLQLIRAGKDDQQQGTVPSVWALKDVSFAVQPGTIMGIIGANGAGKTTLLKVLGRVTLPTQGRALVRGRVVSLLEVGAGFQPWLSGRENIYLNAALYGIPRSEVARRFDEIVEFAELTDFIDTPVKRYSSGMYLRLAFSVAINMEPDILLADEVLAVGDLSFQERCLRRVREAGDAGLTVLFVSHDMAAITRLCDRVLWLASGKIVDDGDPEAVVSHYERSARDGLGEQTRHGQTIGEHGRILHTALVNTEGKEIGAARVSQEVLFKLTFRVESPGADVRCSFSVSTRGIPVFRSVQPDTLQISEPGVYVATARVPAHLLSDTVYTVDVGVVITRDGQSASLAEHNALTFQVFDADERSSARGSYTGALPGVVMPRLEWDVVREQGFVAI
jgi:lipopolysaccharide transport system ATP-binding protein